MGLFEGKTVIITGAGRAVLSDGKCGSIGYGIATAFAKVPDKTLEWFKTCDLDEWTYNKSIQKACESFRVDENLKKILKSLKK